MFRESQRSNKAKDPQPSRRQILAGLFGLGITVPIDQAFGKGRGDKVPKNLSTDDLDEQQILERENKALKIMRDIAETVERTVLQRSGGWSEWTPADIDNAHDSLARTQSQRLRELFGYTHGDEFLLTTVHNFLALYQAAGLLKRYIAEHPQKYAGIVVPTNAYTSRAADYLPTGTEITERDIDPQGNEQKQGELFDYSPWSKPERIAEFRALVDEPGIRRLLQSSNYTLAEAYSLIKAISQRQHPLLQSSALVDRHVDLAREFMNAQKEFMHTQIIGPKTERLIGLTYYADGDQQFDRMLIRDVGIAASVPAERITTLLADELTDGKQIKSEFLNAIATSSGETTIFCNTHGEASTISITDTEKIDEYDMGVALIARVVATKNPDALKNIHIFFSSCSSHRFATNTIVSLRFAARDNPEFQRLGIPFENITLPQITSSAQEGRLGYTTQTLRNHLGGIQREGALTGAMMMHVIQPEDYASADYTFFVENEGKIEEIGQRDSDISTYTG